MAEFRCGQGGGSLNGRRFPRLRRCEGERRREGHPCRHRQSLGHDGKRLTGGQDSREVKIVVSLTFLLRLAAIALTIGGGGGFSAAIAAEPKESPCDDDAMIVFDASGSMAGNVGQGIATTIPRIDEARHALAEVLPSATKFRRVGLITYGPGPYQQCNVHLDLKPTANAGAFIMRTVNALTPAGRTPLTEAVKQA